MKKRYLILPLLILLLTSNVYAITSNDVTYDNEGTVENLTTTLDNLYSELKKYKTGGSVAANQMLEGATGYSKGELVTGTIKSKAATTYTPGTSNQTIAAGQYLSGAQTIKGDANLTAANIAKGKSIFGVSGTYTSDANATAANILSGKTAYVNGSKVTGTMIDRSNDAGGTGLSYALLPTKLEMNGNQLRLAINSGFYGTNVYSNFNAPAIVVDNLFAIAAEGVMTVGSASSCGSSVSLSHNLAPGSYLFISTAAKSSENNDAFVDFLPAECNSQVCSGLSAQKLYAAKGGYLNISGYLVNVTRSFSAGSKIMRVQSENCAYGGPFTVAYEWVKIG